MHSLLANPGTVSVEALERTQREESRTPPGSQHQQKQLPNDHQHPIDLEADLKSKLNIMGKQRKSPAAVTNSSTQRKQQPKKRTSPRTPQRPEPEPELLSPKAFANAAGQHAASNGRGSGLAHGAAAGIDCQTTEPLTQGQMVQVKDLKPGFVGGRNSRCRTFSS